MKPRTFWEDAAPWIGIIIILAYAAMLIWLWYDFFKITDTVEAIRRGTLLIVLSVQFATYKSKNK